MKLFTISEFLKKRLILTFGGIILFFIYIVYKPFNIDGDSMSPSYENKETIWANRMSYDFISPKIFDVIVFYDFIDDEFLIKRVIGIPDDKIEIINGDIFINDILLTDEFSYSKVLNYETLELANESVFIIPEDYFWVIGDNRDSSWYGLIHKDEIIGKVID